MCIGIILWKSDAAVSFYFSRPGKYEQWIKDKDQETPKLSFLIEDGGNSWNDLTRSELTNYSVKLVLNRFNKIMGATIFSYDIV